jgi:hypothetical protein
VRLVAGTLNCSFSAAQPDHHLKLLCEGPHQ